MGAAGVGLALLGLGGGREQLVQAEHGGLVFLAGDEQLGYGDAGDGIAEADATLIY